MIDRNILTTVFLSCLPLTFLQGQEAPSILVQPLKASLTEGEPLLLEVDVAGDPTPTIQWYLNGDPIEGFTDQSLFIPRTEISDSGRYYLVATNSEGNATSEHARVTVRSYHADKSVARQWNEEILAAIRLDYPAPTVHSRNLFHTSAAMYDAWCAYDQDGTATPYFIDVDATVVDILESDRKKAISYAAFTVLKSRYRLSPSAEISLASFRNRMLSLGYDPDDRNLLGDSPSALGNRIGVTVLARTYFDGANEKNEYADQTNYIAINAPLIFKLPGINFLASPNQWQPLAFDFLVLQNGIPVGAAVQTFLGPNWGGVTPFALTREENDPLWYDPGPPPLLSNLFQQSETETEYKESALEVIEYSSWLDPSDQVVIDVSPAARHNNTLGTNDGSGYQQNPYTNEPYEPNLVSRADYGRILAEFWADGPDSETPPGHWNSVANYVSEHPLFQRRFEGDDQSDELSELEWDIKTYFALNGALSDAAIACWESKRYYNYVRPITMIRYLAAQGQASDESLPSYNEDGILLKEELVEVITAESSAEGERHAHLADYIGEIALYCWRGVPENPATDVSGVGWIRAAEWMPFQRDTFVTPPFGAYTSGHSTFSRAAAEILTAITGDAFFPGGLSTFSAKKNAFLEFEVGPQEDLTLTWATYYDAADEAGLSRLYGGIHVRADDFAGRIMGADIGQAAFAKAKEYFAGTAATLENPRTYEKWSQKILEEQPNRIGPTDKIDNSHLTNAERYIVGLEPLEVPEQGIASLPITVNSVGELLNLDLQLFFGLDAPFALEFSHDLKIWSPLQEQDLDQILDAGQGGANYNLQMGDSSEDEKVYLRLNYAQE